MELTRGNFDKMIQVLKENKVPMDDKVFYLNTSTIEIGLKLGQLKKHKGNVDYGGILVFDVIKNHIAMSKDY